MPETALPADPWFSTLASARRQALLERARPSTAPAGARVYGIGDPPDGLWAVLEGEVRLVSYPAVGVESVSMIVGPGAWFGELSVLDGGPRPHDAVVAKAVKLLHVPLAAFDQLAEEHPIIFRDLGILVCSRQRSALSFMAHSIAQPIAVRLVRTLLGAARASGGADLHVRQEELAAMIGVSRQTVNKELKVLERAGLVELAYGRIRICDPAGLRTAGQTR